MTKALVAFLAGLAHGGTVAAQTAATSERASELSVQIPRVDEPPRLEWFVAGATPDPRAGAVLTGFQQRKPGDGTPVSQGTTAFLSYDQNKLYVVFVCKDEPGAVRANVGRRESISNDDAVAIYLDTFHDRKRAYVFMANPLGVQLDGLMTEGQADDWTFDAVWEAEGRLTDDGYIVRFAIPFRSLRFSGTAGKTWGVALARLIRRNNEEAYWPYITERIQSFVPQFGTLAGLREVSRDRNIQVQTYGVLARARVLDQDVAAFQTAAEERAGLDAKVVVRAAVTLDATLNPDFSQVESDDPQVTVNERFEVFFPEKRPFFLENAGYFQTPVNLLFSRRIIDPGLGGRFTGKLGRWAVGGLVMNDRAPTELGPGDSLFGRDAAVGVLRLQREIGGESTVGVLVTDRELAASNRRAYAVDARVKLGENWAATGQVVGTGGREISGARVSGSGVFVDLDAEGRHVDYAGGYRGFTSDFATPLGFVQRTDIHRMEHQLQYSWRPDGRAVVSYGPTLAVDYVWDRARHLQDREVSAQFKIDFTRETQLEVDHKQIFELFDDQGYDLHSTQLSFGTEWLKWLALEAQYLWGTAVNHDPAPDLAPFVARASEAEVSVTLRPTPRLRLQNTYLVGRLATKSARVFTERDVRTKLNYQFNRSLSLRAIVDYGTVVPDSTLTDEGDERGWKTDVLLTYLPHPGTALHIGYIDRHENLDIVAGTPPSLRRTRSLGMSIGRQVFVKVSYLVRFQ
jgi:uncharacterized protein DUF5916